MKRAFTLIELMVVVGIMSFLGVAATGGYSALQRGMAERAATDAATTLLRAAKERALVDRTPTAVFCYNRLLREATEDENAVIVGEAVAVRRAGRITYASGGRLIDEFMDAVGSYDIVDESEASRRKGMRLWRFADRASDNDMLYSVVADAVVPHDFGTNVRTYGGWAEGDAQGNSNYNHVVYAFVDLNRSTHSPTWTTGSGYGFEFASVQLPHGFAFGNSGAPSSLGQVQKVKAIYFDPDSIQDDSVDVSVYTADGSGLPKRDHRAGTASSKEKGQVL